MDLRALFARIRPWCLRAAGLLRAGALVVAAPLLLHDGAIAVVIAVWLLVSAIGLWWRRIWTWRLALIGDTVLVVAAALKLLESGNLQLFTYIAAATVADVVLLSFGQAALDPGGPPPP